jgi:hypothetical protein
MNELAECIALHPEKIFVRVAAAHYIKYSKRTPLIFIQNNRNFVSFIQTIVSCEQEGAKSIEVYSVTYKVRNVKLSLQYAVEAYRVLRRRDSHIV